MAQTQLSPPGDRPVRIRLRLLLPAGGGMAAMDLWEFSRPNVGVAATAEGPTP